MTLVEVKVRKFRNTLRIIIPDNIVESENITEGDLIKVNIMKNKY